MTCFLFLLLYVLNIYTPQRFGAKVTVASVMPGELLCKMSRGIKVSCNGMIRHCLFHYRVLSVTVKQNMFQVMADVNIDDAAKEEWDLIVLPGGMPGTKALLRQR